MVDAVPTWEQLRDYVGKTMGATLADDKVGEIQITKTVKGESKLSSIKVGGLDPATNEKVLAILFDPSRDLFYVVPPSRGALSGMPLLYGKGNEARKIN